MPDQGGSTRRFQTWTAAVACLLLLSSARVQADPDPPPNILFVFIDDIGWGDLSCYGSPVVDKSGGPITPNLDRIASEGIRFTQGYVASPICSPSRIGVLTGMLPARNGIHSFIDSHAANLGRNMNDWLLPDATTSARLFRNVGYATGQFGKWHMGNGRDVNDAPVPGAYGFDESLVAFEGNGNRLLYLNDNGSKYGLSQQNEDASVGAYEYIYFYDAAPRHTDAALSFITNAVQAGRPFYVHVPYNDTHSPYNVPPGQENDFDHITANNNASLFLGELHNLDRQIGRLVDSIDALGVGTNTLVVIVGDNGAPNDTINAILNRNGGLRGGKRSLWEGGIREPFIIRMPGAVPSSRVNSTTAVSTLDLMPTFCSFAGIRLPSAPFAGENMKDVFLGSTRARRTPQFWEFGTSPVNSMEGPKLAVRVGNLKFMRDPDGGNRELYDLSTDANETVNLITEPSHAPDIAQMEPILMQWYQEIVRGEMGPTFICETGRPPALIIADNYDLPDGASVGTGFAPGTGVNENLAARLSGTLAGQLSYLQTDTGKAASAHSIVSNTLTIAKAPTPTAFQFSADGVDPLDFGNMIRGRTYEWRVKLDIDDPDPSMPRMTLGIADSPSPPGGVGGHDLGIQLDLVADNTISVMKRIDAASNSGGSDVNTAILTGLPAGVPVEVRVVMNDSTDYTGYHTTYEVFINGVSVDSGNITFANDSRYLIFDTAPNIGPVHYNDFALATLDTGPELICRIPTVGIAETEPATISGVAKVRLYWSTQPGRTVAPYISPDLVSWEPLRDNGLPIQVTTGFGTIKWLEADIPAAFQTQCFIRLEIVD